MSINQQLSPTLEARHGKELQNRFFSAKVAVCGLGGLGSNIAVALARAGVGNLTLIDFDRVDISNLNRQHYKIEQIGQLKPIALKQNISEFAPHINLSPVCEKITERNIYSLLSQVDIVCEAFDDAEAKAMLVNFVLEKFPQKYIVAASGMAGLGSPNLIHTRKVKDHFYLSGDEISEVSNELSLFAPRAMLCAAHQAQTVLRIIAGEFNE